MRAHTDSINNRQDRLRAMLRELATLLREQADEMDHLLCCYAPEMGSGLEEAAADGRVAMRILCEVLDRLDNLICEGEAECAMAHGGRIPA